MKVWHYIGEFFLFRWLFGKLQHIKNDDILIRKSNNFHRYTSHSFNSDDCDWDSQSYDDFNDEQEDYDMMDDF